MVYDIFISYRRDGGKELARPLKSELELRGYRVFLDFDELKDGIFDRRIMEAIDAAPIFIVILSPHALDRCVDADDWVRREIEYALEHGRHFIPIDPDRSFTGFPPDIPDTLKAGLGQHQFSQVMFEQLFKVSVDKMVRERIEPLLQQVGRAAAQEPGGALFHVETDLPCRILKFGKEIAEVQPGSHTAIRLRKGRHKLEIVSTECPDDRLSLLQTVEDNEMEDLLTIELTPVREKRLKDEAAECRRREEEENRLRRQEVERRTKEEAERKAREEAERRRRSKAEAETLTVQAKSFFDRGDWDEAIVLWRKAAELGSSEAQYNLGYSYKYGEGVVQDIAEAVKWWQRAVGQGHRKAQRQLGICYYKGEGVTQDFVEAVNWWRKAIEQGDCVAQCNLGNCYYNGEGVEQDCVEAVKLHRKTAARGNPYAHRAFAELGA